MDSHFRIFLKQPDRRDSAAPAAKHEAAFSRFTPPIASTGIFIAEQISCRRSIPCGGQNAALDGVEKIGSEENVIRAARSAACAASSEWQETPIWKFRAPCGAAATPHCFHGQGFFPSELPPRRRERKRPRS